MRELNITEINEVTGGWGGACIFAAGAIVGGVLFVAADAFVEGFEEGFSE